MVFASSALRLSLDRHPFDAVSGYLLNAFAYDRDHAAISEIIKVLRTRSMSIPDRFESADLAFCKPSLTSSISKFSHYADQRKDASGVNGLIEYDDYGFHTDREINPWWLVDLLAVSSVKQVDIVNRLNYQERFMNFKLDGSIDGCYWVNIYNKIDLTPVSSDIDAPLSLHFPEPAVARYIRITLLGHEILHLRRIRVFGSAV